MFRTKFAVAAGLAVLVSGSPAIAGEWKGTTKPGEPQRTPIFQLFYVEQRPSICAFSGLNDEYYLDGDLEQTRTQSYGTSVVTGEQDPQLFNPGIACNEGQGQ